MVVEVLAEVDIGGSTGMIAAEPAVDCGMCKNAVEPAAADSGVDDVQSAEVGLGGSDIAYESRCLRI